MANLQLIIVALSLLGLGQAAQEAGTLRDGWPTQSFKTEPEFHPPVLKTIQTAETAPGLLFFAPAHVGNDPANPIIMTQDGDLVWQGPPGPEVTNFNLQEFNGKSYLHWFTGNLSTNDFKHGYGVVPILDHEYRQAFRVCLPDLGFVTPDNIKYPCYNDFQESEFYTPRGTVLITAYNVTRHDLRPVGGGPDELTLDAQIYEIEIATGNIVFSWSSLNHTDQLPITWSHYPLNPPNALGTALEGTRRDVAWDYFHINAIQGLADGYLVSSRHFWQAVKLNLDGEVDWILDGANLHGNFTLEEDGFFEWQHHFRTPMPEASADAESMILHFHDNRNSEVSNGTHPTVALELQLDFESKKATVLRRLINESNPVFVLQEGSYQTLPNGNILVGHGAVPIFEEYGPDDEIHFTGTFGITNITNSYRVFKYANWHAVPYYPPKAVAIKQSSGDTIVYMSWNGATDVTRWEVMAGRYADKLKPIGFAVKQGFETNFTIPQAMSALYVQVRAYENNKALKASQVVKVTGV